MITVNFNNAATHRSLNETAALLELTNAQVVTRFGRLWLKDCVGATPPTGRGAAARQFGAQKKVGESRITRDIRGFFPLVDRLEAAREDTETGKRVQELKRAGNLQALSDLLTAMDVPHASVISEISHDLHQQMRPKARRIHRGRALHERHFLTSQASRAETIRDTKARLGQAKGGWGIAAQRLRVTLPSWAKRHVGKHPGLFIGITDKIRPSITFGNGVPYIQARQQKIMGATLRFRERQMKLELEKLWRFAGNNNLGKLRQRIQSTAFEAFE